MSDSTEYSAVRFWPDTVNCTVRDFFEMVKTLPFTEQALVFRCLQYKSFENTVGKEEIARIEQFLLFPQCFLPFQRTSHHFHQI